MKPSVKKRLQLQFGPLRGNHAYLLRAESTADVAACFIEKLEEYRRHGWKIFRLEVYSVCAACGGLGKLFDVETGHYVETEECPECGGRIGKTDSKAYVYSRGEISEAVLRRDFELAWGSVTRSGRAHHEAFAREEVR